MKSLTFCIAIVMVLLAVSSMSAQSKKSVDLHWGKMSSLREVIQEILNEPKYVSLKPEEKLRILVSMHEFLYKHIKNH